MAVAGDCPGAVFVSLGTTGGAARIGVVSKPADLVQDTLVIVPFNGFILTDTDVPVPLRSSIGSVHNHARQAKDGICSTICVGPFCSELHGSLRQQHLTRHSSCHFAR